MYKAEKKDIFGFSASGTKKIQCLQDTTMVMIFK